MAKKQATKAERDYMGKVAGLGCIICEQSAQVHHIREGQGMAQRAPHELTIPLCQLHHTGALGIHTQPQTFKNLYGSELNLLALTIALLNKN